MAVADLARAHKGLTVFVARDLPRATDFAEALRFFDPKLEQCTFPSWGCLPYYRIGPSPGGAARRMATLSRLAIHKPTDPMVLILTAPALMQRVPSRDAVKAAHYPARVGRSVDVSDLERHFAMNGYVRASTVSERGEFAVRGGVIDVFPPGAEEPGRLDLFGDTLESIRAFDPETQRSTKQLHAIDLLPVSEALLDPEAIARFRSGYLEQFGAPGDDPLYEAVSHGQRRAGLEHYLPLLYPKLETLFDYLPKGCLIGIDHLASEAREERLAMVEDAFEARSDAARATHYRALKPASLYLVGQEEEERLASFPTRRFSPFQTDAAGAIDLGARM